MKTGTVKWFNESKGFGFITPSDGTRDVFVHHSSLSGGSRTLKDGQKVNFDIQTDAKGPRAVQVTVQAG